MMLATGIREGSDGYTDMRIYRIGGDQAAPVLSMAGFARSKVRPGKKLSLRVTASEEVTADLRWARCIGPKRRPCARTKPVGISRTLAIPAGAARLSIPPNYARGGKKPARLGPGRWRLIVAPTDRADIAGSPVSAGLTVIKPRR